MVRTVPGLPSAPRGGRLPDFLLIGAPKAGTTALHAALAQHPGLFLSPVKEPKYYLCLAMLSETDDRTLRMSDLAGRVNASLSRLSHVISKLERRGWVARQPSPHSRRVTLVTLTEEGWKVLVEAAPGHVETVRSLVFEGLSAEDVAALERVAGHIVERIEASRLGTTS